MKPGSSAPVGRLRAEAAFQEHFGAAPLHLLRAPGRVNLLGESDTSHLMLATDTGLWLALRPRMDQRVILYDADQFEAVEFQADHPSPSASSWRELVKGVPAALRAAGQPVAGWEGCLSSDLPRGPDFAVSAALAMVVARAFALCTRQEWNGVAAARLCLQARLAWGGGDFTLHDAVCLAQAEAGRAVLVDPLTLTTQAVSLPSRFVWVQVLTGSPAESMGPQLQEREMQCRAAARQLGVLSLREVSLTTFTRLAPQLDELSRRRVRHVVTEGDRVQRAVQAMTQGDGEGLGILLNMSQASLRDDYDAADQSLDSLANVVRNLAGCAGTRVANGAVVALVAQWALASFEQKLGPAALQQLGLQTHHTILRAAAGLAVL